MLESFCYVVDGTTINQEYHFHFISDIHGGSRHVVEKRLDNDIKRIEEDETALWFGMGDLGDWIAYSDKRFDSYESADWLDAADPWNSTLEWLEKKLKPIAGKCLGLIRGNHEVTVANRYHLHVHKMLAAKLGALDLGDMCFYRVRWQRTTTSSQSCDFFLCHGWGGGRRSGGQLNKIEMLMMENKANVYAFAHVHGKRANLKLAQRGLNKKGSIVYEERVGVVCGTYLEDSEYMQRNGYGPSVLGSAQVVVRPASGEIWVVN